MQVLIDNLIERGLDPKVCRLFIIDGAKALRKVIRSTFRMAEEPCACTCRDPMKRRKPYWIKRFDQRGRGQYCTRFYSPVQRTGIISSHAILGGLHHHYVRV